MTDVDIIKSEHLSKWYGQVIGLNDVTVSVPAGITGLLGPNGAGKSTFMKLITGQLKPSKGAITVLGEPIWNNPSLYSSIGFCPEQDSFYERMTGREWVSALLGLNGANASDAGVLAHRALEMVDLTDAAATAPGAESAEAAAPGKSSPKLTLADTPEAERPGDNPPEPPAGGRPTLKRIK